MKLLLLSVVVLVIIYSCTNLGKMNNENTMFNLLKKKKIIKIEYSLIKEFRSEGNPVYKDGIEEDSIVLQNLNDILMKIKEVENPLAATAIGEIRLVIANDKRITIRPVYHSNNYKDLFYVDNEQYPMPKYLEELIQKWRTDP